MGLTTENSNTRIKAALLATIAHLAPVRNDAENLPQIDTPTLASSSFDPAPLFSIQDPVRPQAQSPQQAPRVSSLPGYDVYVNSGHLMEMKIARYREQEPNMAAYHRLQQRMASQPDLISEIERPASSFRPTSAPSESPLEERMREERNSPLNNPESLTRTITRARITDLTLRKGAHLTPAEANYVAFEVEAEVSEAFREGNITADAIGIGVGLAAPGASLGARVATGYLAKKGISYLEGDTSEARALMKKFLQSEASAAMDLSQKELQNKVLQQMAKESPHTYDSLNQRDEKNPIVPNRQELEKLERSKDGPDTPASLLEKGAVKGGVLSDKEKSDVREDVSALKKNAAETEEKLDKAASSSLKLKKAEEELLKKKEEFDKAGADPTLLAETKEYKDYEKALENDLLHQKEVHACIEQSVDLISRIDPKAGQLFSRSYNLLKGFEKAFGAETAKTFGGALSNLKFSDLLSLTNLTFALFDGIFGGGPDATQQALANIQDTLDHMDKKLDTIIKNLSDIQKENRENFAKTNGQIEAVSFQAQIFHRREMEIMVSGFRDLTHITLAGLKKIDGIDEKLDELTHDQQILTGLVLRVRDELKYVSELIKVSEISNAIENLKEARRKGRNSSGNPEALIADFQKVVLEVFSVASKLADSAGLQISRSTERKVDAAELKIFDLLQFPLGDHPVAVAKYLGITDEKFLGELRSFVFLDEVVSLLLDISDSESLVGLTPEQRERLRLSHTDIKSFSENLIDSQKKVHELGEALEQYTFGRTLEAIRSYRGQLDSALSAEEPLGNASPRRNFNPRDPERSLQAVADAEPMLTLNSEFPELLDHPQLLRPEASAFHLVVMNPRWKQAVLMNNAGLIAYYAERASVEAKEGNRETAAWHRDYQEKLAQTPIMYGNVITEEYSKEPKEGFIPLYASGHWDECSRSGAFKKDGTPLGWSSAPEVVVDVGCKKVAFNGGALILQPSLRIHQVIGTQPTLQFNTPGLEVRGVQSLGASFDDERGVRTERPFTNEAPGLPGEKIHLEVEQHHRIFLAPTFQGVLKVGEVPVGNILCSFPEQHSGTFVDVRSTQEFSYALGFNTYGRNPKWISRSKADELPLGYPYGTSSDSIHFNGVQFAEPEPLNQLHLQAQRTSPGEVMAVRFLGQKEAAAMQIDVTAFQGIQARLIEAVGTALDQAWAGKDGVWRDRVLGFTASDKEISQDATSTVGMFKQGDVWNARVHVRHSVDGDLYLTVPLSPNFAPSGLGASFQLTMNGDISELRDGNIPQASPLKALGEMKSEHIQARAQTRANVVVKQMKKGGSALQQGSVGTEAEILLFHNFIEDYGYQIVETDFELSVLEGGSIRSSLGQQWRDSSHSLLQLAGYLEQLETGVAKGKDLFNLIDAAERDFEDIRGRIDRAKRAKAQYANPQLDRISAIMAHRLKAARGR